jgi:hypothetical protein
MILFLSSPLAASTKVIMMAAKIKNSAAPHLMKAVVLAIRLYKRMPPKMMKADPK